jgi:hypothetical protein
VVGQDATSTAHPAFSDQDGVLQWGSSPALQGAESTLSTTWLFTFSAEE